MKYEWTEIKRTPGLSKIMQNNIIKLQWNHRLYIPTSWHCIHRLIEKRQKWSKWGKGRNTQVVMIKLIVTKITKITKITNNNNNNKKIDWQKKKKKNKKPVINPTNEINNWAFHKSIFITPPIGGFFVSSLQSFSPRLLLFSIYKYPILSRQFNPFFFLSFFPFITSLITLLLISTS